jgi:hypothetical protein
MSMQPTGHGGSAHTWVCLWVPIYRSIYTHMRRLRRCSLTSAESSGQVRYTVSHQAHGLMRPSEVELRVRYRPSERLLACLMVTLPRHYRWEASWVSALAHAPGVARPQAAWPVRPGAGCGSCYRGCCGSDASSRLVLPMLLFLLIGISTTVGERVCMSECFPPQYD